MGISPLDGFDQVKMAYKRRRKDAESNKDAEHLFKVVLGHGGSEFGYCCVVNVLMSDGVLSNFS